MLRTQSRAQSFYDGEPGHLKGICHLPMEPVFCERTREVLIKTAAKINLTCRKTGTIVVVQGPRYSTKAESIMFQKWGGELVGMTTVPEVSVFK